MNNTNVKLDDVRKAFAAEPAKGRDVKFKGKVKANNDLNTHIQGLVPYRTFHLVTQSDFGETSGRLLTVNRTPGQETLISALRLPVLRETKPFFFHPGGCQIIGDCLAVPIETGNGESVVTLFDVSKAPEIREVSPALRLERPFHDSGSVGVTNFTIAGKNFWLLCAYDNGATDFYLSEDETFPGKFKVIFSATLGETELQALNLVTDAADQVFAIGFHREGARDTAILYAVDLSNKTVSIVEQRHLKTTGPDDFIGGGPHFRWGVGIEIISATELAFFCSGRRYNDGCLINGFDSTERSMRAAARRSAAARKRRPRRTVKRVRRRS
jgi:hypothetical protein